MAALYLLQVALSRPLAVTGAAPDDGFVRTPGIVHVHTTLSDGGGTPEEVIRAARAAGLRFLVITDHNNLDAKPVEGYRDGVLVIVGTELSTTRGHILGLGIADPGYRFSGDAQDGLQDIRDLGGFAVAAHPESPREDLRFSGWDLPGSWGVEIVNGDSEWRRAGPRLLLTAALYGINSRYALLRSSTSPAPMLARWDALLASRDAPGLAGADAHSRIPLTKTRALRVPSYEALFSMQRNYALLEAPLSGDFETDRGAVLDALRRGRLYVGLDAQALADGFGFVVEAGAVRATMGDAAAPSAGMKFRAGGRAPEGARVVLLRDGKPVAEGASPLEGDIPGPGVYRVEVRLEGADLPWILSNPIYVFDAATRAERARRAAWPEPEAPHAAVEVLDAFEGKTAFTLGADARSWVKPEILDRRGGADGKGAGRLQFR
ncbi:MAG TPA: CehA/McbA family metallohydrolase, partial [Vicinamibacteria bacterium]